MKTIVFISYLSYVNRFLFHLGIFFKVYALASYYLVSEQFRRRSGKAKRLTRSDIPLRREHVAVVTGGAQGIGLEVVRKLLSLGMHVVIGAPLTEEGCRNLKNIFQSKSLNSKVSIWPLDLCSLQSVQNFSQTFLKTQWPLLLLVNNAGVMFVPYQRTANGLERHFQVNYLGHCLLTALLLPQLIASGTPQLKSRIINLASSTHFAGHIDFDDLQSQRLYSPYHSYLQSKLAVVLWTFSLQRHLDSAGCPVSVNCVHPGVVYSGLYKHVWWAPWVGPYLFLSPSEGAETVVYAGVSPALEGQGGCYLEECQVVSSSRLSNDPTLQHRMWEVTWTLLNPWTPVDSLLLQPASSQSKGQLNCASDLGNHHLLGALA